MAILQIDGLTRRFGGVTAVDALSLAVNEGELVSIIGPNGAGKTTVFNLVTGLDAPDAGSVTFGGRDITGLPAEKLAPLGFARTFQHGRVFGNLSVLDNVLVGAHTRLAAVRPQWPLIGPIGELALALVRPGSGEGRGGSAARRRDGDPRAVRRAARAAHRQSGLLALLREPPPARDRARAVAEAARAVPRRADRRHEPDRNRGDARDHPHPEGPASPSC